jgi:5,5'-dehydrodivanillate O-demethylase
MYDGTGQCVEQPADSSRFADRVRIAGYPVRESMGLVFAYLGEGEPPEFPTFPGFDDWDGITLAGSVHWRFNFFQSFENSVDITHTTFVHRGSHDYSAEIFGVYPEDSDAGITNVARRRNDSVTFIGQLGMPNMFLMDFPLPPNNDLSTLMFWVPIDDHNHHVFNVRRVPKAAEPFIKRLKSWGMAGLDPQDLAEQVLRGELDREDIDLSSTNDVFFQDFVAQIGQGLIADRGHEQLGRGDKGVIKLRQLWTTELRKVAAGEPIRRWASPTLGPIMYYKAPSREELDALLEASPLRAAPAARS